MRRNERNINDYATYEPEMGNPLFLMEVDPFWQPLGVILEEGTNGEFMLKSCLYIQKNSYTYYAHPTPDRLHVRLLLNFFTKMGSLTGGILKFQS